MANTIPISTLVVREALAGLFSQCQVVKACDTSYSRYFKPMGEVKKGGTTISVPKPSLGTVRSTWDIDVANDVQLTTDVAIDTVRGIDFEFTEAERSLSLPEAAEFSEQFIMPKVSQLAATIDAYCANYMKNEIYQVSPVTTIGTAPNSLSFYTAGTRMIQESLAPMDGPLSCIISPRSNQSMVAALQGQYNPSQNISEMYTKGQIAKAGGMDWYLSQNLPAHTHGTCTTGTSPAVSGYTSSTMTISGVTSGGTLKAGDSFYMSACYPVNFETKGSYSDGQRFTVVSDTTASGTNITVSVMPNIVISGPNQNVSGTPVGSTVTFHQTTSGQVVQNDLILHKKAFALCFAELYQPKGMEVAKTFTKNGVSVAYVKGFDINTRSLINRLDVYFGIRPLQLGWAARVIS